MSLLVAVSAAAAVAVAAGIMGCAIATGGLAVVVTVAITCDGFAAAA